MTFKRTLTASATALALAFATAPAVAQTDQTAPAETPEFSASLLEAFADAALQVADLRETYTQALEQAENEAEAQALVDEANAATIAAVEDAPGITLDEYIEVGEAAAADPELTQRIAMLIDERIEN